MNITVIVRTLNEERNIARFCEAYAWADKILIADGGSKDRTIWIARRYPNVNIRDFGVKTILGGRVMNPEAAHINFLIDWAREEKAEWVILEDADHYPTKALIKDARNILDSTKSSQVFLFRLYKWMQDQYFPRLNDPGPSIWAWRQDLCTIRAISEGPTQYVLEGVDSHNALILDPPLAVVHDGWPTEEIVREKMRRYEAWGIPQIWPTETCGPLEPLPDWAKE